jgi:ABC-type glutathione transport system ATPase component
MPELLALHEVSKAYRRTGVVAADRVSLAVAGGEAVGLVGPSGAGKSTVARMVAGLVRPDSGTITLEGADVVAMGRRERRAARRRVHLVFQDPYSSLAPHLRVADLVAEPLRIHARRHQVGDTDIGRAVAGALDAVRLSPGRYLRRWPHELSGGERQRVALARALVGSPDLVVADEPTAMLDLRVRAEVLGLMRALRDERSISWLLITHDLAVADGFCHRLVVMAAGRVVEEGAPQQLVAAPKHPTTIAMLAAARRLDRAVGSAAVVGAS